MDDRHQELHRHEDYRVQDLHEALVEGSTWEMSSGKSLDNFIAATLSKHQKKTYRKRLGTRAVKECDTNDSIGGVLSEEHATHYRALAARANVLALGRPELSFTANELCRAFPARRLKMLVLLSVLRGTWCIIPD